MVLQIYSDRVENKGFFAAHPLQPFIGNFAKKRPMTTRKKATVSLLSLIMSVGFSAVATHAQTSPDRLQIYAGPQSVSPGQNISVTIEFTDAHGKSVHDKTVYLTYIHDGVSISRPGKVSNGLVSFDVQAQRIAGIMTFKARVGDLVSNHAPVLVLAAQPSAFELKVDLSRNTDFVELTTETITDAFGNPVSDQTTVTLDWIDPTGVKRSEVVQLSNGRMNYASRCPLAYNAPLKIRAVLKNVEVFSSDLSILCAASKDSA